MVLPSLHYYLCPNIFSRYRMISEYFSDLTFGSAAKLLEIEGTPSETQQRKKQELVSDEKFLQMQSEILSIIVDSVAYFNHYFAYSALLPSLSQQFAQLRHMFYIYTIQQVELLILTLKERKKHKKSLFEEEADEEWISANPEACKKRKRKGKRTKKKPNMPKTFVPEQWDYPADKSILANIENIATTGKTSANYTATLGEPFFSFSNFFSIPENLPKTAADNPNLCDFVSQIEKFVSNKTGFSTMFFSSFLENYEIEKNGELKLSAPNLANEFKELHQKYKNKETLTKIEELWMDIPFFMSAVDKNTEVFVKKGPTSILPPRKLSENQKQIETEIFNRMMNLFFTPISKIERIIGNIEPISSSPDSETPSPSIFQAPQQEISDSSFPESTPMEVDAPVSDSDSFAPSNATNSSQESNSQSKEKLPNSNSQPISKPIKPNLGGSSPQSSNESNTLSISPGLKAQSPSGTPVSPGTSNISSTQFNTRISSIDKELENLTLIRNASFLNDQRKKYLEINEKQKKDEKNNSSNNNLTSSQQENLNSQKNNDPNLGNSENNNLGFEKLDFGGNVDSLFIKLYGFFKKNRKNTKNDKRVYNSHLYLLMEKLDCSFKEYLSAKNKRMELLEFKMVLFQIIFSLAVLQSFWDFKHNDLHLSNVLMKFFPRDPRKKIKKTQKPSVDADGDVFMNGNDEINAMSTEENKENFDSDEECEIPEAGDQIGLENFVLNPTEMERRKRIVYFSTKGKTWKTELPFMMKLIDFGSATFMKKNSDAISLSPSLFLSSQNSNSGLDFNKESEFCTPRVLISKPTNQNSQSFQFLNLLDGKESGFLENLEPSSTESSQESNFYSNETNIFSSSKRFFENYSPSNEVRLSPSSDFNSNNEMATQSSPPSAIPAGIAPKSRKIFLPGEDLQKLQAEWQNSVQITDPKGENTTKIRIMMKEFKKVLENCNKRPIDVLEHEFFNEILCKDLPPMGEEEENDPNTPKTRIVDHIVLYEEKYPLNNYKRKVVSRAEFQEFEKTHIELNEQILEKQRIVAESIKSAKRAKKARQAQKLKKEDKKNQNKNWTNHPKANGRFVRKRKRSESDEENEMDEEEFLKELEMEFAMEEEEEEEELRRQKNNSNEERFFTEPNLPETQQDLTEISNSGNTIFSKKYPQIAIRTAKIKKKSSKGHENHPNDKTVVDVDNKFEELRINDQIWEMNLKAMETDTEDSENLPIDVLIIPDEIGEIHPQESEENNTKLIIFPDQTVEKHYLSYRFDFASCPKSQSSSNIIKIPPLKLQIHESSSEDEQEQEELEKNDIFLSKKRYFQNYFKKTLKILDPKKRKNKKNKKIIPQDDDDLFNFVDPITETPIVSQRKIQLSEFLDSIHLSPLPPTESQQSNINSQPTEFKFEVDSEVFDMFPQKTRSS